LLARIPLSLGALGRQYQGSWREGDLYVEGSTVAG